MCLCGSVAVGDPVVSPLGGDSARAPVGPPAPIWGSMESSDAMSLASMTRCNARGRVHCETGCLCFGTDVWWGSRLHLISVECVWEKAERVRMPNWCVDWSLELAFALDALECMH